MLVVLGFPLVKHGIKKIVRRAALNVLADQRELLVLSSVEIAASIYQATIMQSMRLLSALSSA